MRCDRRRVKPSTAPSSCLSRFGMGENSGSLGRLHPPGNARNGGRDSSGEVVSGWFSAAEPAAAGLRGGRGAFSSVPPWALGGRRALAVTGELGVCSRKQVGNCRSRVRAAGGTRSPREVWCAGVESTRGVLK